ncbi:hypothetical protein R1flu_013873 [Riccia fluitans]|uniref:Uncharacterized protein n=1 Tax=Riccia fluitans TaxID=41844 RepID=A0ABD1YHM3_9MARC
MEMIDGLVQDEEINSGVGAIVETNSRVGAIIEKIPTLQSMVIQPIVPTQLPRPPTVGFEELSLLTRDEGKHYKVLGGLASNCPALPHEVPRPNGEAEPRRSIASGAEPRNAFGDTQAQWDVERCELVHERDRLKEDLLKLQDVFADAEQQEEALRAEHKRLQEEYS